MEKNFIYCKSGTVSNSFVGLKLAKTPEKKIKKSKKSKKEEKEEESSEEWRIKYNFFVLLKQSKTSSWSTIG